MTLESGFWSLDKKKGGSARVALPGIRQTSEVVPFATQLGWLLTLESGFWSLDKKKGGSARVALPGIRQTSEVVPFATQLGWLMTQRAGRWSLDKKKSGSARVALTTPDGHQKNFRIKKTAEAPEASAVFANLLNYKA
ncbi:hypothetical protein [Planococcus sp. ISL-110]|uniref:hypothetical protein n=1 Tax=Planococcus sp. ISL-110 TaxID=2819167 RepID=UPI001BE899AE|nr:hypothetical protein [Planococcus sp. ISL-110]MBT2571667.1 hypothetical protein [Planococcus sp. ISL-110]